MLSTSRASVGVNPIRAPRHKLQRAAWRRCALGIDEHGSCHDYTRVIAHWSGAHLPLRGLTRGQDLGLIIAASSQQPVLLTMISFFHGSNAIGVVLERTCVVRPPAETFLSGDPAHSALATLGTHDTPASREPTSALPSYATHAISSSRTSASERRSSSSYSSSGIAHSVKRSSAALPKL